MQTKGGGGAARTLPDHDGVRAFLLQRMQHPLCPQARERRKRIEQRLGAFRIHGDLQLRLARHVEDPVGRSCALIQTQARQLRECYGTACRNQ